MKEGLNKKSNSEFEDQKKNTEWNNQEESLKYLASKFSEMLAESPIVIYEEKKGSKAEEVGKKFDKVQEVRTDKTGTGGHINIIFDYNNYIAVDKDRFDACNYFQKQSDYYKITEESYQNILTMMDKLIKISGFSEVEKEKMFQMVVENFKNKIIKDEDLKQ